MIRHPMVSTKKTVQLDYRRLPSERKAPIRCYPDIMKNVWLRICCLQSPPLKTPQPEPSPPKPPLSAPQEKCQHQLMEALESSCQKEEDACSKWKLAKKTCDRCSISFKQAMDTELPIGATALRRLVDTIDHKSLRFVHSHLPAGNYSGNVYLGPYKKSCPKSPERIGWDYALNRPIYRGETNNLGQFCGYGVLNWFNYKSYVGEWSSNINVKYSCNVVERLYWMEDGTEQLSFVYQTKPFFEVKTINPCRHTVRENQF